MSLPPFLPLFCRNESIPLFNLQVFLRITLFHASFDQISRLTQCCTAYYKKKLAKKQGKFTKILEK